MEANFVRIRFFKLQNRLLELICKKIEIKLLAINVMRARLEIFKRALWLLG